ncbi:MAG: glycosyltransferase family 4 protein [Thioploca sp.]|nr:glycosyltransferase family 4 protein [Thioploca sp.]
MRIKIQQFLFGKSHSWSVVGQNFARAFLKAGHDVDLISTDGFEDKYCSTEFKEHIKQVAIGKYDLQLSYTAPHNWPAYLNPNLGGFKAAIWNYEYNGKNLLPGFAKYYNATDQVLPSSNFTKEVFSNMKIPENKMMVVPHGINLKDFENKEKYKLKTNKDKKILLNIAQPHRRKAIHLALESFGQAFNKDDDVCLVAKILIANKSEQVFNVDWWKLYGDFERKFPNHAEVEVVTEFIPEIATLYNACDINFSATYAECWHFT